MGGMVAAIPGFDMRIALAANTLFFVIIHAQPPASPFASMSIIAATAYAGCDAHLRFPARIATITGAQQARQITIATVSRVSGVIVFLPF